MSIGVITATSPSATLVASQVPPSPTSTTATSTGRVGEGGVRHRGDDLEEGHRHPVDLLGVHQIDVRGDLTEHVVEATLGQRLAVDRDPLGHRGHVRAGEASGAQPVGPQQRLDHGRGAALAVGAGDVDHRVGPLRITEQLGQGGDAPQAGRDPVLGPATGQGGDDLGVRGVLGQRGGLRHGPPSLGRSRARMGDVLGRHRPGTHPLMLRTCRPRCSGRRRRRSSAVAPAPPPDSRC